jgi:hypothetical protein
MSAEKLRNIAKIPGMSDLIGSLGVELVNDIADSYSDMYEALEAAVAHIDFVENKEPMCKEELRGMIKALAKAEGE